VPHRRKTFPPPLAILIAATISDHRKNNERFAKVSANNETIP
jgi:hypothetical protein